MQDITAEIRAEKALLESYRELEKINRELKEAKEKVEESERLKTSFLANISHEIRTPMNGIMGFAELLEEPNIPEEEYLSYISMIQKSGNRMLGIINNLINISRIESGQEKAAQDVFSLDPIMKELFHFFKPEAAVKGLDFFYRENQEYKDVIIRSDRMKLNQILINLIKNALKFTFSGIIEFGYYKKQQGIELFVKDTGIGIPSEKKLKIFERFYREDSDRLARVEGAGLGLSITKSYIDMLGGTILLDSEPGKGSTFYVRLPVPE